MWERNSLKRQTLRSVLWCLDDLNVFMEREVGVSGGERTLEIGTGLYGEADYIGIANQTLDIELTWERDQLEMLSQRQASEVTTHPTSWLTSARHSLEPRQQFEQFYLIGKNSFRGEHVVIFGTAPLCLTVSS